MTFVIKNDIENKENKGHKNWTHLLLIRETIGFLHFISIKVQVATKIFGKRPHG
jgi:hypothetical protein